MTAQRVRLPLACTLTPVSGAAQLEAWKRFNDEYLLKTESRDGSITVSYAKVDDAITRLDTLVRTERTCCAFASWQIDATDHDLRLTVAGSSDQLRALTFFAR